MTKKWTKWNESKLFENEQVDFVNSKKFKLLIFSFLVMVFYSN